MDIRNTETIKLRPSINPIKSILNGKLDQKAEFPLVVKFLRHRKGNLMCKSQSFPVRLVDIITRQKEVGVKK